MNPRHPRHHKDTESRSLHLHQTVQVISCSNLRCFLLFLGGDRGLGLTKMDEKKIRILIPGLFVLLFLGSTKMDEKKWGKYLEPFIFYSFAVFQGWLQISIEILHEAAVLGYVFCLMFCACPMTSSTSFLQSHFGCPGRTHIGSFVFPVPNARFYTRFKDLAISSVSSQVRIFSGQSNCGTICLQTLFAVYWHFTVLANLDSPTQI